MDMRQAFSGLRDPAALAALSSPATEDGTHPFPAPVKATTGSLFLGESSSRHFLSPYRAHGRTCKCFLRAVSFHPQRISLREVLLLSLFYTLRPVMGSGKLL